MPADILKSVFLPLGLIFIMFGMGLGLAPADFKRVLFTPRAALLGTALQLLGLPVLAFSLALIFRLPGDLSVGLMLVAACPGGATSNVITHLSKGDTALSVTLTAISSVVTVFSIPIILGLSTSHFLGGDTIIHLPFLKTMIQLMVVTLLPISIGMIIHAKFPEFSKRMASPMNLFSIGFLALIILVAIGKEADLGKQIATAGPIVVTLNLLAMGIAFTIARLFRLPVSQRISISVEVGIQNATLALAIALGMLENPRFAIPAVVYGLFMFITGASMILIFGRKPLQQTV